MAREAKKQQRARCRTVAWDTVEAILQSHLAEKRHEVCHVARSLTPREALEQEARALLVGVTITLQAGGLAGDRRQREAVRGIAEGLLRGTEWDVGALPHLQRVTPCPPPEAPPLTPERLPLVRKEAAAMHYRGTVLLYLGQLQRKLQEQRGRLWPILTEKEVLAVCAGVMLAWYLRHILEAELDEVAQESLCAAAFTESAWRLWEGLSPEAAR